MVTPSPVLESSVLDDLEALSEDWIHTMSERSIKHGSAILRRLLIDAGGGTLRKYRRELGLRGDPKIYATDLKVLIQGRPLSDVGLAVAAGGRINGAGVGVALQFNSISDPPPAGMRGPSERWFSLTDLMNATCLVIDGTSTNRHDLLKYVANKLGGVHVDDRRGPDDHVSKNLDKLGRSAEVMDRNVMFAEILCMGQQLICAPDVSGLLRPGIVPPTDWRNPPAPR